MGDSNPRPPPCKGGALPSELIPQGVDRQRTVTGGSLASLSGGVKRGSCPLLQLETALRKRYRCRSGVGKMGLGRIELPTSRLSGVRSNRTELQAPRTGKFINLLTMCQVEKDGETVVRGRRDSSSHTSDARADRYTAFAAAQSARQIVSRCLGSSRLQLE